MPATTRWSGSMTAPLPIAVAMTGTIGVRINAMPIAWLSLIEAYYTVEKRVPITVGTSDRCILSDD